MSRPGYANRAQLKAWADQLVSKGEFPRLIRQLILETTPGTVSLGMPAGDGVATGGWDGSVRAVDGNAWVPKGYSVWELSVNSSPGVKADDDYSKRAGTPDGTSPTDTTYVEAILRTWKARGEWAKGKAKDKVWKSVRALGLDDVEAWLQSAPVTWAWISEEFHLNPYGLRAGLTWWKTWSSQTSPAITPELVLAGRADEVDALTESSAVGVVSISGPSINDVCAFVAAAAVSKDARGEGRLLARLAFVDDRTTWRRLLEGSSPLVLVALDPSFASEVPPDTIHTVVIPLVSSPVRVDIELPSLDANGVARALRASEPDLADTDSLGRLARRSLTALRRRIARKPELVQPVWAGAPVERVVRASLLLGSWTDRSEGDRQVAEQLAGMPYEDFKTECLSLARGEDPYLTHVGDRWQLVSPVDAWMLLGGELTEDDLLRLKPAVEAVIGEVDPALDIPAEARWWQASAEGKVRRFSGLLSSGLSETLALLGVHGGETRVRSLTGAEWASYLVRELLDAVQADQSGRGWQSVAPMLPLLTEAAPEVVAQAIASSLANGQSTLRNVFTDEGADLFSPTSPHTYLLWALETLAWSDGQFGQAIDLLARLDYLDPGGRMSNRPANSLSNIFCPWHPENAVSVDRRLKALDALRRRHPKTAEPLLRSLLPEFHGTHFPTASPKFRDWKPAAIRVTHAEYHDFVIEVLKRLIEDAGARPEAWIELLDRYSNLPPDGRSSLRDKLSELIAAKSLTAEGSQVLWRALLDLTGKHRSYPDAQWALPEVELVNLDALTAELSPTTAVDRLAHLFDDWSPYLGDVSRRDDFNAYDEALTERRSAAAAEMAEEDGFDAIHGLAKRVKLPWALGHALGTCGDQFDAEVLDLLALQDPASHNFAMAYFQRRFYDSGWTWVDEFLVSNPKASVAQRGLLLVATRDFPKSWEAAAANPDVAQVYWTHFGITGLGADFAHVEHVGRGLIEVGRFGDALHFVGIYGRREAIPSTTQAEMTAEILDNLLNAQDQIQSTGLRDYDFTEAFKCLEAHVAHLSAKRVANLEWAYLGVLGFEPSVPALSEALATDPEFFADMICLIYRSSDEPEPELTDDARAQRGRTATNAYSLLDAWDRPPGTAGGIMDAALLREWVSAMRERLEPSGRLKHGMRHLGDILSNAPADADGVRPGEVLRDLLEDLQSDDLEEGLYLAIVNGRGVTTRSPDEGGEQEKRLSEQYNAAAAKIADDSPRSAALMRRVAASYEREARRNEDEAEAFRRGLER